MALAHISRLMFQSSPALKGGCYSYSGIFYLNIANLLFPRFVSDERVYPVRAGKAQFGAARFVARVVEPCLCGESVRSS